MTISSDLRLWSRLAAASPRLTLGRAGQLVADRDLAFAAVAVGGGFLARLARAHDAALGIELLRGLGDAVEVEIGGELHAGATGTDHRDDDPLDLLAQPPLIGGLPLVGVDAAESAVGGRAIGEQAAGLVDDRDPLGLEAVDRRGHQVADRAHLLGLERAADLEDDRGRGLRLVAREQRTLGQHQVHARRLHPLDGADGAGELTFERAQVIDVLHEAGGAERVGLVENLVADAAALWQAGLGKLHAQARHAVLRHQHDGAVVLELVGDRLPLEVLHDRGRILEAQVGEQRRHLRGGDAQDQEGEKAHHRDRDRGHGRHPRRPQRFEEVEESLHVPSPDHPTPRQDLPGSWLLGS